MQGIGIELGLQRHAAALAVIDTALAVFVQEVAGVELDAGAVGVDRHGPAGDGIVEDGTGIAEDLPVVVIAALELQRLIVHADVLGNGLGAAEIHGGARHTSQLAGGDILGIIGIEEPAGDGQQLLHGGVGLFVTCQVEIAVVGEVEHRIPVGDGIIDDVQAAVVIQGVSHIHGGIAGVALISMGAVKPEGEGIGLLADVWTIPCPRGRKKCWWKAGTGNCCAPPPSPM